jgi:hypothetical protein
VGFIAGAKKIILDAYGWLNYKSVFSDANGMPNRRAFPQAAAMWVPADDQRRLSAYTLLTAYDNNQAAQIAEIQDGPEARERREFGDPSMFIEAVMAHVLGREQHITVPGAEHDGDGEPDAETAAAQRLEELLTDWADTELLAMRMQQTERNAVKLGDGVYRLAWDPGKRRVTLRAVDPGFFYPVIGEDDDGGEFPERVHFAWELPEDIQRDLPPRLRRITFELGPIGPATAPGVDERGRAIRAVRTVEQDGGLAPVIGEGDIADPDSGTISRQYAWNDEPSTITCYLTDATWDISDLRGPVDVDSLPMDKAVFATRQDGEVLDRLDLMIDFIPVIHIPNTVPSAEEFWGQSSLAKVLQVFDELQAADTDASRASATTGLPMVAVAGAGTERAQFTVGPGAMWRLGADGRMFSVDTSPALRELREHRHDLADRASNVARLPAVALGTIDPSKVPSGFAMQLSMGPLDSLIGSMRLARDHKYALLLKMVQRLHIAGQHPDWAGVTPLPAKLVFGPHTPTDKAAVLEQVATGVEKGILSKETGIRMLMEAGFPIEDAADELKRIDARSFEAARLLADALGNPTEVADFLGRKAPDKPETPRVVLPPTAGDDGDPEGGTQPAAGEGGEGGGNTT